MTINQSRIRHAQLFELLRQQNLSDHTSARLRSHRFARAQLDQEDAAMLQSLAVSSWGAAVEIAG